MRARDRIVVIAARSLLRGGFVYAGMLPFDAHVLGVMAWSTRWGWATPAHRRSRTRDPRCSSSSTASPAAPPWDARVGAAPVPTRLLRQGVKDMVRNSDARMSGTSYGTVVLHVAPESAAGGPLALVREGDEIELDSRGGL